MKEDLQEILFSEEILSAKIKELAKKISEDYKGKDLVVVGILKGSVIFAAELIKNITIPLLVPLMIVLTIMAIGGIFRSDFGLFYQVPRNSAILYPVTDVIDTYIYKGLMNMGNIGMSTAAGLYQSVVGFVLIMITNYIVKKIDPEYGLF